VLDARKESPRPPRGAPRQQALDPFFTQPYQAPEIDPAAPAEPTVPARVSGNIKPKKKVAALFK